MARTVAALLGVLLVWAVTPARAADSPAAGTWKLPFAVQTRGGEAKLTFLIMLSQSEGKWVGDFLGASVGLGNNEPTIADVAVKDDAVRFTIKFSGDEFTFDGRVAKDGKKIPGTFFIQGRTQLVEMLPSKLKKLDDKYALNKEVLEQTKGGPEFFDALFQVVGQAAAKKVKPEEVRSLADRASKAAEVYGPRWQRNVALRLARELVDQEGFAPIAVEQARQAEKLLSPSDPIGVQQETLQTLARALMKAGKPDEVKPIEARLAKLEASDYAEYAKTHPPFKPAAFEGRKAKSDRTVLVELFTGAECPPCVAADLAFDGLEKTYKPADVVLLQYHLHVPGPDPLTCPDSVARSEYYGDKVRGTPTIFFSGQKDPTGGGPAGASKLKYKSYRETIDELLEKPAPLKLRATANRKGNEVTIKATVSDLEKPGDKIVLRFALAEELVRYQGGNGLRYHHHVVRAMPGGPKGFVLNKKSAEHTAKVNLDELRKSLGKYLDNVAKEEGEFSNPDRPLALSNLRVVAFVQNDETQEVLQAVQVDLEEKKD